MQRKYGYLYNNPWYLIYGYMDLGLVWSVRLEVLALCSFWRFSWNVPYITGFGQVWCEEVWTKTKSISFCRVLLRIGWNRPSGPDYSPYEGKSICFMKLNCENNKQNQSEGCDYWTFQRCQKLRIFCSKWSPASLVGVSPCCFLSQREGRVGCKLESCT